jgi:hypothetical protein
VATAYDRTPLLAGVAIAVLIALVAAIDFRAAVTDVPAVPPTCVPASDPACQETRNVELLERRDQAFELEDDYRSRAWLYGFGALAALLAGAGIAFARTGSGRRREVFTDLGVAGVVWMIAGLVLSIVAEGEIIAVPAKPIFYPGVALLIVAAAGTLLTRGSAPTDEAIEAPATAGGHVVRVAGFGCTAIAVALAAIIFSDSSDPCLDHVPDWVDTLVTITWIAAGLAALAGLASLVQRRWLGALIMLGVGPACSLIAAFTTVCWN